MQEILLIIVVTICLITDLHNRKIYNWVVYPSMILGLTLSFLLQGIEGITSSLFGLSLGIILLFIFYVRGGIGAGDVKLLATIGAIKGPFFVLITFIGMGIVGGLISLIILYGTLTQSSVLKRLLPTSQIKSIPYAIPIFIGALITYYLGVSYEL